MKPKASSEEIIMGKTDLVRYKKILYAGHWLQSLKTYDKVWKDVVNACNWQFVLNILNI